MDKIVVDEDGWFEGLVENYEKEEQKDVVINMDETDVDYLDPLDNRNHEENIITEFKDSPAEGVKKRRNRKKNKNLFTIPFDEVISNLKTIQDMHRDELVIDSDVDSPNILLEALYDENEEDEQESNNADEEWEKEEEEEDTDITDDNSEIINETIHIDDDDDIKDNDDIKIS